MHDNSMCMHSALIRVIIKALVDCRPKNDLPGDRYDPAVMSACDTWTAIRDELALVIYADSPTLHQSFFKETDA